MNRAKQIWTVLFCDFITHYILQFQLKHFYHIGNAKCFSQLPFFFFFYISHHVKSTVWILCIPAKIIAQGVYMCVLLFSYTSWQYECIHIHTLTLPLTHRYPSADSLPNPIWSHAIYLKLYTYPQTFTETSNLS